MRWKPGDVVRLKSGGASMAVSRTEPACEDSEALYFCVWLDDSNRPRSHYYPECVLVAH